MVDGEEAKYAFNITLDTLRHFCSFKLNVALRELFFVKMLNMCFNIFKYLCVLLELCHDLHMFVSFF